MPHAAPSPERLVVIFEPTRAQEAEPGVGTDRSRTAPGPRIGEQGSEGGAPGGHGKADDRCAKAPGHKVREHERPGLAGEAGTGFAAPDGGDPGRPLGRPGHEEQVPDSRPERLLVPFELVRDHRTWFGGLVDFEAQDGGARVSLEDDDAVGIGGSLADPQAKAITVELFVASLTTVPEAPLPDAEQILFLSNKAQSPVNANLSAAQLAKEAKFYEILGGQEQGRLSIVYGKIATSSEISAPDFPSQLAGLSADKVEGMIRAIP